MAPGLAPRTGSVAVDLGAFQEESPPGRLQCRLAERQLVIVIPPGSSRFTRSLGCFATCWLGFMALFTGIALGSTKLRTPQIGPILAFGGLFWLVGFGLLWAWIRGRFSTTFVLVEPDRLVMKTRLFGREKYREYLLNEESRAQLVVAYTQNEQPVHAVSVSAPGKPAKFGTFLSQEEKSWLVERINRHLHPAPKNAASDTQGDDFLQMDLSENS